MFNELPEGTTYACTHTTDNTICDDCLGHKKQFECKKCGRTSNIVDMGFCPFCDDMIQETKNETNPLFSSPLESLSDNGFKEVMGKSYPLNDLTTKTPEEIKNQFTNIMHESIDTTPYPAMHYEAYTKAQVIAILTKYARHIKYTYAGKARNV